MSDNDSDNDIIRVENSNSKQKHISLKNIEPVQGIKIIRNESPSISSDDDSDLSSISEKKVKKTKKILRKKEKQSVPSQNYNGNSNNNYSAFSNPKKVREYEQSEMSDESSYEDNDSVDNRSEMSDDQPRQQQNPKETWEDKQKMKQDLLIKIQALEKKGFEFSKKFTMTSNYEEMMFEYQKIKKFIESQSAIKFSRRCLMACVTGLEFLNKRFDPFKLKLEGWSENVMESIDDYDNIFEKLHEKYGGKAEVAPEIELLLTLGGSAFMFHLTNTLLKGPIGGGGGGLLAQNNPNFMASMMSAMSQGMKEQSKPPSGPQMAEMFQQQQQGVPQQQQQNDIRAHMQQRQQTFPKPMETRTMGRQEMKGPSIDQNLFNGTPLASNHPNNIQQMPFPQQPMTMPTQGGLRPNIPPAPSGPSGPPAFYDDINEDDRFSVASSDSSLSTITSDTKSVTVRKAPVKKGKNGKASGNSGGFELNIN